VQVPDALRKREWSWLSRMAGVAFTRVAHPPRGAIAWGARAAGLALPQAPLNSAQRAGNGS
jgi:hypothetical protein